MAIEISLDQLKEAIKPSLSRHPKNLFDWLGAPLADKIGLEYVEIIHASFANSTDLSAVHQWRLGNFFEQPIRVHIGMKRQINQDGKAKTQWYLRQLPESLPNGSNDHQDALDTLSRKNRIAGKLIKSRVIDIFNLPISGDTSTN